ISPDEGLVIEPRGSVWDGAPVPMDSPIIQNLNRVFDRRNFEVPRTPVSLGVLSPEEQSDFSADRRAPRTLDMPIKFPGSPFRVPREFAQFEQVIRRVAEYEAIVNAACFDEYYCYLT